jgi:gliding motility-associated-like protein
MITLSVHVPGGTYVWQDGSKDSIYVVTLPGEYSVLVGYDGCVNSDSINIGECPVLIWFPNAFTPNSDGLNDTFHPIGIGIEKFSMQIFNRWGTMVFETSSPENGWDGTYKGSLCPEETYVFKASYEISGEIKQVNGTITLLH